MVYMNEIQKALYDKAIEENKEIKPCGGRKSFEDCFTYDPFLKKTVFWFNDVNGTTKILVHAH
jgi:hypothetical protein